MQESSDILSVIRFLYKNRKTLLIMSVFGAVFAATITFFLPKKYTSTAVIFPSGGNEVDKNLQFGMDLQNDQLMQLLQSSSMRDSICQKFNLIQYYELDTIEKDWKEKLNKYFERDIRFSKTRYYSIEISAETTQPQLSADIVNTIVKLTETLYWNLIRQNSSDLLANSQKHYAYSQQQMTLLADSLRKLLQNKGDSIQARLIRQTLADAQKNASLIKSKLDYVKERHETPASPLFVIDNGKPAGKKSSPRYSINILLGGLGMFLFMCLWLLLKDLYEKNKDIFEEDK